MIQKGGIMDIAALSINMNQGKFKMDVSLAVANKVLDSSKLNMEQFISDMEKTLTPHLGKNIDIKL
jgi:hypothetical protein